MPIPRLKKSYSPPKKPSSVLMNISDNSTSSIAHVKVRFSAFFQHIRISKVELVRLWVKTFCRNEKKLYSFQTQLIWAEPPDFKKKLRSFRRTNALLVWIPQDQVEKILVSLPWCRSLFLSWKALNYLDLILVLSILLLLKRDLPFRISKARSHLIKSCYML